MAARKCAPESAWRARLTPAARSVGQQQQRWTQHVVGVCGCCCLTRHMYVTIRLGKVGVHSLAPMRAMSAATGGAASRSNVADGTILYVTCSPGPLIFAVTRAVPSRPGAGAAAGQPGWYVSRTAMVNECDKGDTCVLVLSSVAVTVALPAETGTSRLPSSGLVGYPACSHGQ